MGWHSLTWRLLVKGDSASRVAFRIQIRAKTDTSSCSTTATRKSQIGDFELLLLARHRDHSSLDTSVLVEGEIRTGCPIHLELFVQLVDRFDVAPATETVAPSNWDRIRSTVFRF